jgi:hypothetical protein
MRSNVPSLCTPRCYRSSSAFFNPHDLAFLSPSFFPRPP